jgi:hypothetical protein
MEAEAMGDGVDGEVGGMRGADYLRYMIDDL